MSVTKWRSNTASDLIIEVWEALDCESVGKPELEAIQRELAEKFGDGAVHSPASIARVVADEGAVLRHPEIFECDYEWRGRQLREQDLAGQLSFANLTDAVTSFGLLEERRHAIADEPKDLKRLRDVVIKARQDVLLAAQSKILSAVQREEAREVSEWMAVWLRSPQLLPDWLDLRMRAADFRKKFGI